MQITKGQMLMKQFLGPDAADGTKEAGSPLWATRPIASRI
jgi:hypothetical protein